MSAAIFHDTGAERRPAIPINAALQMIASAAWSRGAVIANPSGTFTTLPAADLMRACRGAWQRSLGNDDRAVRVETIIRAVAARLHQPGPVQVSPTSLGVLRSFAGIVVAKAKPPAPEVCRCGRSLKHFGRCWVRRGLDGPSR